MNPNILNSLILSAGFLLLFGTAELLYHYRNVKVEWTRKLVHFGTGWLTLLFPVVLTSHWWVLVLCSCFAGILMLSLKFNLLPSINAIERKSWGSISYPIAVYGSFLTFEFFHQQYIYFYLPILILAICDPIAALFGKRFPLGKFKIGDGHKTLMGSGMFFLSALAVTLILLKPGSGEIGIQQMFLQGAFIAAIATFAEAVSVRGLDNIFIPLAVIGGLILTQPILRAVEIFAVVF